MTRAFVTQTAFTSGELDPRMLGRTDLRAFENGAARLRNVIVETTGGVRRRPGTAYVATAAGPGRLIDLELGPDEAYLLAFSDFRVDVYRDGAWQAMVITPWSTAEIPAINWAQYRDSLMIAHPNVPLQRLRRQSPTVWTMAEVHFAELEPDVFAAPFARFVEPDVVIQPSDVTGTITVVTSVPVFQAAHIGGQLKIKGRVVTLTNIQSSTQAVALVEQELADDNATLDWEELAFSAARGWPMTVSFHQDRMVVGGARDLPNTLWFSRIGQPFNFDLGSGLDDEAIEFRLASNDVQAIRALVSSRDLQVFTSAGEWVVTGEPLTPERIQVLQQSRIGSPRDRHVPPRDVDGATLFAARSGRELREFLFTNTEQAYQATDLALLSRHLVQDPVDQAFDLGRRLFMLVMADGSLATVAIYRNADIAAWSLQETDGRILSAAVVAGETMLLVERAGAVLIERLDESLLVDAGVRLTAAAPTVVWAGLDHLEGQEVALIADDLVVERAVVSGGQVILESPARELVAGLPYAHVIEPLPAAPVAGRAQDVAYRPIRVTLRLFETRAVRIDVGEGLRDLPLHAIGAGPLDRNPAPFTGDRSLRALGWRRGAAQPPWRIEQDVPLPCMLLSATIEVKVND